MSRVCWTAGVLSALVLLGCSQGANDVTDAEAADSSVADLDEADPDEADSDEADSDEAQPEQVFDDELVLAAADICANVEAEPDNDLAVAEYERDFAREMRRGLDARELEEALTERCGRLLSALGSMSDDSSEPGTPRAVAAAQGLCTAMRAETSGDLAYMEFEDGVHVALAQGISQDELYVALSDECGSLLSEIAPFFGPTEEPPQAQDAPSEVDYCPDDYPEGTEYLACVDGVVIGMADGYCDTSYDLFSWYGVAGNFNPYPVDVFMTFELVTPSGQRAGDGTANIFNLRPDQNSSFEVIGTSILAEGSTCRVADVRVSRAR